MQRGRADLIFYDKFVVLKKKVEAKKHYWRCFDVDLSDVTL